MFGDVGHRQPAALARAGGVPGQGHIHAHIPRPLADVEQPRLTRARALIGQHVATEGPESGPGVRCQKTLEGLAGHEVAVAAQEGGPGQVDLADHALRIDHEGADRREIEQLDVLVRRQLGRDLGALQFFVLKFQLDLVHLQLVDQRTRVALGRHPVRRRLRAELHLGLLPQGAVHRRHGGRFFHGAVSWSVWSSIASRISGGRGAGRVIRRAFRSRTLCPRPGKSCSTR